MMDKKIAKQIAVAKQDEINLLIGKENEFYLFEKSFVEQNTLQRIYFYKRQIKELQEMMALAEKQEELLIADRQK